MPVRALEYTPIVAPRGEVVHATSLSQARKTACGKKCIGWRVALRRLNCPDCKRAVHIDVRTR